MSKLTQFVDGGDSSNSCFCEDKGRSLKGVFLLSNGFFWFEFESGLGVLELREDVEHFRDAGEYSAVILDFDWPQ